MFLLVPAHPGRPRQRAVKRSCVCLRVCVCIVCDCLDTGTLSSELTVIPGYLPLKLNVAQSMTSGTDLGKYVMTLCHAVTDYSTQHFSNHPHGISLDNNVQVI